MIKETGDAAAQRSAAQEQLKRKNIIAQQQPPRLHQNKCVSKNKKTTKNGHYSQNLFELVFIFKNLFLKKLVKLRLKDKKGKRLF